MIRIVAGIDVGLSSAAAAIYGYAKGSNTPVLISTTPIKTIGEGVTKRIDVEWLWDWLVASGADIVYVERGKVRSAQGTMSDYLRACGQIEATVILAGLDEVMVPPEVWQRALGLTAMRRPLATESAKKNCSVILARELFPERADSTFKYFNSHNEAEASLIALYGAARCDLVNLQMAA